MEWNPGPPQVPPRAVGDLIAGCGELVQEYEHAAVFYNDCVFGGVKNTPIPNFIYRWTRRDIEKTIAALKKHGFNAVYARDRNEARETILKLVPQGASVVVPGSASVRATSCL